MIQEDKELLLKYLCAALPYHPVLHFVDKVQQEDEYLYGFRENADRFLINDAYYVDEVKPYLRPISSMTEEEMDKLFDILHIDKDGKDDDWIKINDDLGIKFFFPTGKWIENIADAYDYLYSIHIDFRGLIPKGLAIEVTENNNPYKE